MTKNQLNSYTALRIWYYNTGKSKAKDTDALAAMCSQYLKIATFGLTGTFVERVRTALSEVDAAKLFMQNLMKASALGDISVRVINMLRFGTMLVEYAIITGTDVDALVQAFATVDLVQWTVYENKYFVYYMQVLHDTVLTIAEDGE